MGFTMRKLCRSVFQSYFRRQLLMARGTITQERMAPLLDMSTRAYAALETGESCCGLLTLLIFLRYFCPDRNAFFELFFAELERAEHEAA